MAKAWAIKIRDNEETTIENVPAFRREDVRRILREMGLNDQGKPLDLADLPV